ncbi:hypothetical protein EV356DRAFT_496637 [Viridothelium virens]|uniref:Actin-like ATPase domain-containing protein n=1 Tax=Viridothelium virens TaxID=1048519 RepID=A0A6A6HGU2_VIRVR|nr:hypothetical protein EV356DRAFT_496637 [Viridothelium virens]
MRSPSKPDLVIGVDLGQTCTGVSYANLSSGADTVRWIQKWPGRAQACENKVPTVLVYPHGSSKASSWGFLAESKNEQKAEYGTTREWFKTLIDPDFLEQERLRNPQDTPSSYSEVQTWCRDYLGFLYEHVKSKLAPELGNVPWEDAEIEFVFSVPTTWKPHPSVENFRALIGQAGFGGPLNARHSVTIGLTEAEAAAVHTSTESAGMFSERDLLLICDAGGGTTDLSTLRVTDTAIRVLSLEQVDVVEGANVGSAAIDDDFMNFAEARLREANQSQPLDLDIEETVYEMMKGKEFQNIKCEHGAPDETPMFSLVIPGLSHSYSNPPANIERGELHMAKEDLRGFFDRQLHKLFRSIDTQLQNLNRRLPDETVSHLVLSGGLGQSLYVQEKLKARYANGSELHPNAQFMQVRIAPDPQLAVCKGLVADRLRKLTVGRSVLGWRCCRASYGIVCKELYDKHKPSHVGREIRKDSRDGKTYVLRSVEWFVKKGEPVSIDRPIEHDFMRKVDLEDSIRVFPTEVVVSYDEKDVLPNFSGPGVQKLCDIESDLSSASEKEFKEKNRRIWQFGQRYFQVKYQIKVIIGPADLRFELCEYFH